MGYGYGTTSSLKFFKTLKIYKNSTGSCEFTPATKTAYSYSWCFVKVIKGKVIFNDYSYSPTTSSHQSCVRSLLKELKIKIHATVYQRESLTSGIEVEHVVQKMELARFGLTRKGLTQKTRSRFADAIKHAEKTLKTLRSIGASVPRGMVKRVKAEVIKAETERLERNRRYNAKTPVEPELKTELTDLGPVDLLSTLDKSDDLGSIDF